MTLALTIATPFADFSELSDNFAQRVDSERLMLPYSEPVTEGEWVTFTVTYADGSTALAGTGRCQGSYDNGEEHPPEYRFDVVVDSLSIEGAGEVMFERLLMARNSQIGEANAEPTTGEVSIDELEAQHAAGTASEVEDAAPVEAAEVEPSAELESAEVADDLGGWDEPQPTAIANLDSLAASSARSEPPPPPPSERPAPRAAAPVASRSAASSGAASKPRPGRATTLAALPSPHTFNGTVLTRPSLPAAWSPEPMARPDAMESSGLFDYGRGGLPKPANPPRPELAVEARVQLAPAPGRPARRVAPAVVAGPATMPPAADAMDMDEAPLDSAAQYDLPVEEGEA